jgi:hypothetical protein
VRFGDIARVDAHFRQVQVTRTSGTVVTLDRFAAGDIDDGVRVWDPTHGIVDLDTRQIRRIEFLPTPPLAGTPERLYGVVTARQRDFTGFIQWHQRDGVSTDALEGVAAGRDVSLRYDTIRSIVRHARNAARVILRDGGEVVVSNSPEAGQGHRGVYVEDRRYGRVLIPWDAFERVDFSSSDSGPGYADFPPGRSLAGTVVTSAGRRLAGRLVYDFDESETSDTFDLSDGDVSFNIPLGRIASIVPRPRGGDKVLSATITLHGGEELHLERNGDLGKTNAGMLIFVGSREHPEHVPFSDVERIELDRSDARPEADRDERD